MWEYYQAHAPGAVILLGADVWNGTPAQLSLFRGTTGATYPLLLNAGTNTGGNLLTDYVDRDNFVILDQNNVVRFDALLQGYFYGGALDVPRMRALVDSLLANVTAVDDPGATTERFAAGPSPFTGTAQIAFSADDASAPLSVAIYDIGGRRVRTLFDGTSPATTLRVIWDGRDAAGAEAPAGVYLVRAETRGHVWTRRIVRLR